MLSTLPPRRFYYNKKKECKHCLHFVCKKQENIYKISTNNIININGKNS